MSILGDLDDLILRETSNPPLVTKGAELTYAEMDTRIIGFYDAVQSIVSGVNVTAYDAGHTYDQYDTDIRNRYASYGSRIWQAAYAGSPSSFSGQTPAEGVYWTQVTLAEMLPNILELARLAENIGSGLNASAIYETDWQTFTEQDLNTNPIDLTGLEAQGAGFAVVPLAVYFSLDAGGTVFDFGVGGLSVIYAGSTSVIVNISQASINGAADVHGVFKVQDTPSIQTNTKMQLYSASDATQGNGTYYMKTLYKIIEMPF